MVALIRNQRIGKKRTENKIQQAMELTRKGGASAPKELFGFTALRFPAVPCGSLRFPAVPCGSLRFPAVPCGSLRFPAVPSGGNRREPQGTAGNRREPQGTAGNRREPQGTAGNRRNRREPQGTAGNRREPQGTALGLAFSYIGVRISEHHIVYAMSIETGGLSMQT